jgi:ADP-ribosylglycohydrolase
MGGATSTALNFLVGLQKPDPEESYKNTNKKTAGSQSNGCLMRITPLSVFCSKLNVKDIYQAVRLQTKFTHSNENAIGACYLYTFAISKLIEGIDGPTVYELTKHEAQNNADLRMY